MNAMMLWYSKDKKKSLMRHFNTFFSFSPWALLVCLVAGSSKRMSAQSVSPSMPRMITPALPSSKLPASTLRTTRRSYASKPPCPFVPLVWEKGTCGTVVIKGHLGALTISSQPQEQVGITLDGLGQVSRTKHCMIIDSRGPQLATGTIVVPQGMNVIIESGCVNATLQGLMGSLKIHGGHVRLSGDGTITRLSIKAGIADVHLKGIIGMTHIQCGQGHLALGYHFEEREVLDSAAILDPSHVGAVPSKPSASGLSLYTPPVRVFLHMAKGKCDLFFPRHARVDPGNPDITTSLERCKPKECDFKIAPCITHDVSVNIADIQSFPAEHIPPSAPGS